jgi:hypothetical protein
MKLVLKAQNKLISPDSSGIPRPSVDIADSGNKHHKNYFHYAPKYK